MISALELPARDLGSTNCSPHVCQPPTPALRFKKSWAWGSKWKSSIFLWTSSSTPDALRSSQLSRGLTRVAGLFECLLHDCQERLLVGEHLGRLTVDDDGQFDPHRDGPPSRSNVCCT